MNTCTWQITSLAACHLPATAAAMFIPAHDVPESVWRCSQLLRSLGNQSELGDLDVAVLFEGNRSHVRAATAFVVHGLRIPSSEHVLSRLLFDQLATKWGYHALTSLRQKRPVILWRMNKARAQFFCVSPLRVLPAASGQSPPAPRATNQVLVDGKYPTKRVALHQ